MTRTFNTKMVVKALGSLLLIEAFALSLPMLISLHFHEKDWRSFAISAGVTFLVGLIAVIVGRKAERRVGEREGYFIVATVWVFFSLFGLMPFYLSGATSNFTDSFFEAMSGFTTTGATIFQDVESLTHGLLFWRALMQWLGGMGIIVLSIAILPMFGLGGMQLYAAEVTGLNYEKVSPRIADTSKLLWSVYLVLTVVEFGLLWVQKMPWFDAVCHSFSTIATGGFSTNNDSLLQYGAGIQYTIIFFMLLSGISFSLLIFALRGKPKRLFQDEETRWYLSGVGIAFIVLLIGLLCTHIPHSFGDGEQNIRHALFTAVSSITGTGFAVADYTQWAVVLWVIVFFCMITGACAGSTSGGIKWVRIMLFAKSGLAEIKRRIHPNAIIPVKVNGKPVTQQTTNNVMAFMVFYIIIIFASVLVLCATGINLEESFGTTISSISNVGASIGQFGPLGSYATLHPVAKWTLSFVMLIGRLELFTILLAFSPAFWKK